MAKKISIIKNKQGDTIYPITTIKNIVDLDGKYVKVAYDVIANPSISTSLELSKLQIGKQTYNIVTPQATATTFGGIKASPKDSVDTLEVKIDTATGKAYVDGYGKVQITGLLYEKQDKLISNTNIKTINNQSILGSGNIEIQASVEYATKSEISSLFPEFVIGHSEGHETNPNEGGGIGGRQ